MCHWKCSTENTSDEKYKNSGGHRHGGMPALSLTLPNSQRFDVPIWALFWIVGPMLWWGAFSPSVLLVVVGAALVLGVRVNPQRDDAKPKNDDSI